MSKIDVRAIYLYSRNPQENGFPHSLEHDLHYSFCFYDAVEVKQIKFPNKTSSALLAAYETSLADMENPTGIPFPYHQVLFAFKDEDEASTPAFEDFWAQTKYPLLFISLINLNNSEDLDCTLERIEQVFDQSRCRTYLTFDHCDILLFFRGDSFREFSDNIFRLNYGSDLVNDTITLFTFANESKFPLEEFKRKTGEKFGVHIRIGVKDYSKSQDLITKAETLDDISNGQTLLTSYRLLGRNDMALYHPAASLAWLAGLKEILIEEEAGEQDPWYTTYDLSVLVPYDRGEHFVFRPKGSPPSDFEDTALVGIKIGEKMDQLYKEFRTVYLVKCKELSLSPDRVWLRWLKSASDLAVTFFKSRLSVDLGTCLIPQFFGLLQYGAELFKSGNLRAEHMDQIREILIEVFVNITILVDSLNHSNRQFIQVPPYNSISFEMPPKHMAYFTALAHRLTQVLQDRPYLYGITISPKFACELEVSSFAAHKVLDKHELITISLEERSIYTLQLTTEAMAHEISHFVGDDNRCRKFRRECIVKCALAELLDCLVCDTQEELTKCVCVGYDWRTLNKGVETLWHLWSTLDIPSKSEADAYLRDVYCDLLNLPMNLDEQPALRCALFQILDDILQPEELGLCDGNKFWEAMAKRVAWKMGISSEGQVFSELQQLGRWTHCRSFISDEIYHTMRRLLSRYAIQNQQDAHSAGNSLFHYHKNSNVSAIRYQFSETFADLQAILLFNMTWEDYCKLLIDDDLDDVPPRMLAVAKTLINAGSEVWPDSWPEGWPEMHSWKGENIRIPSDLKKYSSFSKIEKAIVLDPRKESDSVELQHLGFSPSLIAYLVEYLGECAKIIRCSLLSEEKQALVKELLTVHQNLDTNVSISALNNALINFISTYHKELGQDLHPEANIISQNS